jgi:hypothetical protein
LPVRPAERYRERAHARDADELLGHLSKPGSGVREAQEAVDEAAIEEIHNAHRYGFGTRVAGISEEATGSVKCLHAFTALHIADAIPNPIAEWTLQRLDHPYPEGRCCTAKDGDD